MAKNKRKVKISGLPEVIKNLNKEIENIEGLSMKGLIRAVIIIRRDMDKTSPLIPIDTGNLRASWFTVTGRNFFMDDLPEIKGPSFSGEEAETLSKDHQEMINEAQTMAGKKLVVIFGFSANYALWVHEMDDANFKRPGSGSKFLESSILRNRDRILAELKKHVTIKR